MANRKRRENETYEEYRKNLKEESKQLKIRLSGRYIWNSEKQKTYKRSEENERNKSSGQRPV